MLFVTADASAPVRLVAFPFAGGGASSFVPLRKRISAAALFAAQLPGREERQHEPACTDLRQVLDACLASAEVFEQRPYVLLGVSVGARIAFHLAQSLVQHAIRAPEVLVLCACAAPGAPERGSGERAAHQLTDADLLERMQRFGGIPSHLGPDQRAHVLPKLRADLRLLADSERLSKAPVPVPIVAIGGRNDPTTTRASLERWAQFTECGARVHIVPGGHFFLFDSPEPSLRIIEPLLHSAAHARRSVEEV